MVASVLEVINGVVGVQIILMTKKTIMITYTHVYSTICIAAVINILTSYDW